ncbi:ABC transporter permease [Mesorhizobium sp.]|uniref:ABC transporter permease n=1 Tax=Mesorhizobium sp. TaxID=1871066 RepID=UPI000FE37D46|nr:ABC transporter permease [Mesorhizobium sp.]RWH72455.1 MAG: ABC transporter permease [Mesorhizobium sp.]RWL34661.1 MAG: ABC transporter permease [Mesorhizobium sp.]RWL36074.1 MAG: ABC transporter permease [Mesorhizobium sp.]RWL41485.1 MAG: ABC transporter permease [Mesorhizobium sp.]RWL50643.1 MAG: ABC transporter permease [Mesorhizobium sp.]
MSARISSGTPSVGTSGAAFQLFGGLRQIVLLPVIALLIVFGSLVHPAFLTWNNVTTNILAASAVLAVLVVAESMLIIAGKFDLSLQSLVALAPMISAILVVPVESYGNGLDLNPIFGLVVLFAVGAAVGILNGLLVARLNLNAFIVTLAMLILLQGITLGISRGKTIYNLPDAYTFIGRAAPLGVPLEVWIALAVIAVAAWFLRFSVIGRQIYAIGGNVDAARATGVKVERVVFGLFVVASLLASLAGWLMTARIASVTANQGNGIIFTVFAASVIGGIDLNGGRGQILGAATGVLLLGIIQNLLVLSQVPAFWVMAIYGAVILLSLMLSAAASSGGAILGSIWIGTGGVTGQAKAGERA